MRLTIIVTDNIVVIDGQSETVDLTSMSEGVRTVQWDEDAGHVEYYNLGEHQPNEEIDNIDDYQWVIDAWEVAAVEREKKEQAALDNAAKPIETVVDQENLDKLAEEAEAQAANAGEGGPSPLPKGAPPMPEGAPKVLR
jgi:hypothetical protein